MSDSKAGAIPFRAWTAWCDYYATGEGRLIMGCIALAHDEGEARAAFARAFGEWWGQVCTVAPGVVCNEVTAFLWSGAAFGHIEHAADMGCLVHAKSQLQINCS